MVETVEIYYLELSWIGRVVLILHVLIKHFDPNIIPKYWLAQIKPHFAAVCCKYACVALRVTQQSCLLS